MDVDNLCDAIELAFDKVNQEALRLFVTDGGEATWRQVVDEITPVLESRPLIRSVSRATIESVRRQSAAAKTFICADTETPGVQHGTRGLSVKIPGSRGSMPFFGIPCL